MIEKLECTCIEAYKTRKMRDPNCCACSCDHNDLVEQLAKANERVKEQEIEISSLRSGVSGDLLAKYKEAQERVKELEFKEGRFDQYALESEVMRKALLNRDRSADDVSPLDLKSALNKFAIEQQIKGAADYTAFCQYCPTDNNRKAWAEQLRKEQDSE